MNVKKKFVFIIIIFFFIFISKPLLYSNTRQPLPDEYSADKILGFVKYLITKNEYYKAHVELGRLDSYYPGYINKDIIFVSDLFFFFKSGAFPDIIAKENITENSNTNAVDLIFKTDALFHEKEFVKANSIITSPGTSAINKDLDLYIYKRMLLSYILLNNINETKRIIENQKNNYNNIGFDNDIYPELISYGTYCYNSMKNPYTAMAAGVIPGMGYVYAKERATGIIAFVLLSALSAATYYSFKTNNKSIGIFIGAATTFFYGGSIIGGYLATRRYNDTVMMDMTESLSQKLELSSDRERIFNKYGVRGVGE